MENGSYKVLHYKPVVQKTTNQLDYVPRPIKTVLDSSFNPQFPTCRPLQHYRKTGTSGSHTSDISYTTPRDCTPCLNSRRVGTMFKMIGKKDNGLQKTVCCQPGNVISFSGNAKIRTVSTNKPRVAIDGSVNPEYYADYAMYLKRRGYSYASNDTFHQIPGIDYTKYPDGTQNDSSHYAENLPTESNCTRTIYKPSNPTFSKQGPVDGGSYIARKKYNAITTNNASFVKPWGVKMVYSEEPLYFTKNKNFVCTPRLNEEIRRMVPTQI
jgi:hypothetical protein